MTIKQILGTDTGKDAFLVKVNDNFNEIENNKLDTTGDAKDTTVTFTEATTRENILTTDKMSILIGKIKKFFTDLKAVAFSGLASDVTITDTNSKYTSTNVDGALDEIGLNLEQKADKQWMPNNWKSENVLASDYPANSTTYFRITDTSWNNGKIPTSSVIKTITSETYLITKQEAYRSNGHPLFYRLMDTNVTNVWGAWQTLATWTRIDTLSAPVEVVGTSSETGTIIPLSQNLHSQNVYAILFTTTGATDTRRAQYSIVHGANSSAGEVIASSFSNIIHVCKRSYTDNKFYLYGVTGVGGTPSSLWCLGIYLIA